MRWILRGICLTAAILAIFALLAREAFVDSKATVLGSPTTENEQAGQDQDSPKEPAASAGAPGSETSATDDDGAPLENGMIRALDQMLDQTSSVLGDEEDGLRESLVDADALLTQIKRDNRRAIREANRQVRVPGRRSPNILLIVAEGLSANDLLSGPVEEVPLPNLRSLAGA